MLNLILRVSIVWGGGKIQGSRRIITGLDVGTTKICAIIAEVNVKQNNDINIIGIDSLLHMA